MTLAFTGASGMPYGLRLLECLFAAGVQVDLVYSTAAQMVARQECDLTLPTQPREATRMLAERYGAREGQLTVHAREDWLAPIQERLRERHPRLTRAELDELDATCRAAMKLGHETVHTLVRTLG